MSSHIIQNKLLKLKKILEDSSSDFTFSLNSIVTATNTSIDSDINTTMNMIMSESADDVKYTGTNSEINTLAENKSEDLIKSVILTTDIVKNTLAENKSEDLIKSVILTTDIVKNTLAENKSEDLIKSVILTTDIVKNTDNTIMTPNNSIDTEELLNNYESYSDTNTQNTEKTEVSYNYEITDMNPGNIKNTSRYISDQSEPNKFNNLVINLANSNSAMSSSSKKKYKFSSQ
jgi:hypothetical protein